MIDFETMELWFATGSQHLYGDREFGYMATRLGMNRKVVVGHWQ